jgi:hypothetical protein
VSAWAERAEDMARHLLDLESGFYEGAVARGERDGVYRRAFELTTPVALEVLELINRNYLAGSGKIHVRPPASDGANGLAGSWDLTWPLLEASIDRVTLKPMPPVRLASVFPSDFSHAHLALLGIEPPYMPVAAWPFQVTSPTDAARQEPILWAVAEAELHERVLRADGNWRVLPAVLRPRR